MIVINRPKIVINKEEEKALRDVHILAANVCNSFDSCQSNCPFHTVKDSRCILDLARVALERLEEKQVWEVEE